MKKEIIKQLFFILVMALAIVASILVSCKEKDQKCPDVSDIHVGNITTPIDPADAKLDSIILRQKNFELVADSLIAINDSLKIKNKDLAVKLLHQRQIVENARYYLNIANRNPSQQKFLRGWMNRALSQ